MASRQGAVNKAMAAVTDPAASAVAKQEDLNVRWKAAHEAYEQAAYHDIQAEEANTTTISDEGQQHFDDIASEAESVMGVDGYADLLNASYANDAERTRLWKGQLASRPAPSPVAARSTSVTLRAVAAPTAAGAAAPGVGDEVVVKDNFLYRAGGMIAMHAGETASVLSVDQADGASPCPSATCPDVGQRASSASLAVAGWRASEAMDVPEGLIHSRVKVFSEKILSTPAGARQSPSRTHAR